MRRLLWVLVVATLLLAGCKGEKKMVQYSEVYRERPVAIYVAPINDRAMHLAVRAVEDSAINVSLNAATQHLYHTAATPLIYKGYYVPGPLLSAQLAATEKRTLKQLQNENINDYYTDLGIDAVLFITVKKWEHTHNTWTVEAEYSLRSTVNGGEIMHTEVRATKMVGTDFKGNPIPLKEDKAFAERYGCDVATAQRCRLVEIMNNYVLTDMPSGKRQISFQLEPHIKTHPEYFDLYINPDGSIMVLSPDSEL